MVTYTNKSLDTLYRKDLIPIAFFLQNKLEEAKTTKLLDEISKLNDNFHQFQSNVCITKNFNNLLSSRHVHIERQCCANAQYSRKE